MEAAGHLSRVVTRPDVPRGPQGVLPDLSLLGPPIAGDLDMDRGQALLSFVEANISSRNWSSYGVQALTYDQTWGVDGTPGLCEEPAVKVNFEEAGVAYEANYSLGLYGSLIGDPELMYEVMSGECIRELAESGGDLSQIGDRCDEFIQHTFFPDDSACKSCLEVGAGDWESCVAARACLDEAPLVSWVDDGDGKVWLRTGTATVLACAPDLTAQVFILGAYGDDGSLPLPWDHAGWAHVCLGYWDEGARAPAYGCTPGVGGWEAGHTLGAGGVGRVNYIRAAGEGGEPHRDRIWYSSEVDLGRDGTVSWFWATTPGAGQISAPESGIVTGMVSPDLSNEPFSFDPIATWGMNPLLLRPDGTDESNLDHTFARDWLATLTLKTATTRDGVLINTFNANRCEEGRWEGPFADGSYRCAQPGPPHTGWHNDASVGAASGLSTSGAWSDQDFPQVYHLPLTTIGSTGLPDPLVPGGNTALIAGTATLADPDFDNCAWPHQFVPDSISYEARPEEFGGEAWLWGQTWKFGKDPVLDLRVVLNTNEARGYCSTVD